MTWAALSLYALGVVGAAAAVGRDEAPGLREWVVIIGWPIAVAAAIGMSLFSSARKACRP